MVIVYAAVSIAALLFGSAGAAKLGHRPRSLDPSANWGLSGRLVYLLGTAELAGAVAVVLGINVLEP